MKKVWDISQAIREGIPVWPGDQKYVAQENWQINEHCPVNVGSVLMSVHTGSHADAPLHYKNSGLSVDILSLSPFLGRCLVIDLSKDPRVGSSWCIEPNDIQEKMTENIERVLVKTYRQFPHAEWDSHFTSLSPETVDFLAERGAKLIGIDTPSVDPEASKTLSAHMRFLHHDIRILEGLVLEQVPEGFYELIALPLKLVDMDASPVRAILRSL